MFPVRVAKNDISRPQLRLIIFYEWSCGTPAAETVTKIGKVFGETTVTDRTVRNWFARFQSGENCFEDNDRCGRPTALNNDLLRDAVKERPDVTLRELEIMLGCSPQTIRNHLHDLGYRRVLARWVPHALSPYQMQARVTACQSLILTPQRKEFLADLVTRAESWVPRGEKPCSQRPISMRRNVCFPASGTRRACCTTCCSSKGERSMLLLVCVTEKFFTVFDFFDSQSAAFWKKCLDELPERWLKVVTNDGQYIVD
uniref:HTH_48 domain-containing protein n=1 Tax=Caenorhabditis japonica TaxID=281687 RepID=A0A8R1IJ52_CAEJA